jgi:ABC-2 type transport system permease protein
MNKTYLVLRHELLMTMRRRSFLFAAFGLPLLATLVFAVLAIVKDDSKNGGGTATAPAARTPVIEKEGYVDQSGTIKSLPPDIPPDRLVAYADEAAAKRALNAGKTTAYYLIPRGFVEDGEVYYVYPDSRPLKSDGQDWVIRRTLLFNLLGGDAELTERVWNPMHLESTNLTAKPSKAPSVAGRSGRLLRYLPAIMAILFFIFLLTASNILLKNISSEKENRTIEVLLLSVNPRQLLVGKMVGLGIAGLLHTIAWVGAFCAILQISGYAFDLSEASTIPVSILAWSVVFFVLGFVVYGSLMAGVGSLAPKFKEANHASYVAMIPLFVGYGVGILAPLAGSTNSWLPVGLSMFPPTAPVVMMMRLTTGHVPIWQLLVSVGLLALTAYVVVRAVAATFRAQHLLSGQPFSMRKLFCVLFDRA